MNAIVKSTATHNQPTVLRPQNLTELMAFAQVAAKSSMMPRDYIGKPENVVIAVQLGSELGLAPMQSIQNIAVISGRPAVFGDAMPALCRQSPVCEDIEERFEGEGDKLTAVCIAKRVGKKPITQSFSVEDAKKAGLWGKAGPWQQYPRRMLQMRARGFALRDAFPDVLRGLITVEEAQDIPPDQSFAGTTIEAKAEPAKPSSREQINRDVPMAETKPEAQPQKMSWRDWAESLERTEKDAGDDAAQLGKVLTRADVAEIRYLAEQGQISDGKRRILDCIARMEQKYLADPPEPSEEEAPAIKGEENVLAG